MPQGGWAWRSAIQAPHHQTDRDVGAASIGEGLLAAYAVTHDPRYKRAAVAAGDYLLGVAEPSAGRTAVARLGGSERTPFDDPLHELRRRRRRNQRLPLGLFELTQKQRFRAGALDGMRWVIARAEGPDCPQVSCSWRWTDDPSWRVAYNGVGMGQAGIVLALDAFADRTGDPTFRAYARAGAAHLRDMTADGARPLPRGSEDDTAETGFLSGSAGAAYMFFERYRHDRDPRDLVTARRLLDWVNEQAVAARSGGLRWPLATDQPSSASGFELGAAGIAWVNLRAARATGDARYLEVARRAAVWLRHAGNAGGAWRETPARPLLSGPCRARQRRRRDRLGPRRSRPRGSRLGAEPRGRSVGAGRRCAPARAATVTGRSGTRTGPAGRPRLRAEPSWHWGAAGIAAFAARIAGWSGRSPGGLADS